jgi:hypothetical protein
MLTQRHPVRQLARLAAAAIGAAALSTAALADGPTQPDPPIPPEAHGGSGDAVLLASATDVRGAQVRRDRTRAGSPAVRATTHAGASHANAAATLQPVASSAVVAEPDCRCGALFVRDLERRVEGHVERWEALSRHGGTVVAQARDGGNDPAPAAMMPAGSPRVDGGNLYLAALLVDGMVGFPLHDFRLGD